jgi:hypothetical protein
VVQVNGKVHDIVDTHVIEGEHYSQHDYVWTSPLSGPEMHLSLDCRFGVELAYPRKTAWPSEAWRCHSLKKIPKSGKFCDCRYFMAPICH